MLSIQDLCKTIDNKKILNNINFTLEPSKILGIIGKSGAGKSTLIRSINLLHKPDTGKILFNDIDLLKLNTSELMLHRQEIGMIFQHFNLLKSQTVFDNIAFPLKISNQYSSGKIKSLVHEALHLVSLDGFANYYTKSMSGGEQQRVAIARAIVNKPKLLLSDESTSSLDQHNTNEILNLLLDINKTGMTIVLVSHELDVIRHICDITGVMDNGQLIEYGNSIDILLKPKQDVTKELVLNKRNMMNIVNKLQLNSSEQIILINFIGNETYKPILYEIATQLNVEFNIIHGEISMIKNIAFGQLLMIIKQQDTIPVINLLTEKNIRYEIL